MAPARTIDFSNEETTNAGGRSTVGTAALDTELINVKASLDVILINLAILQRDDTALKDEIVTPESLSSDLLTLMVADFTPRGVWVTATAYAAKDVVTETGITYMAVTAHTSGTFSVDHTAGLWIDFGDLVTTIDVHGKLDAGVGVVYQL